MSRADILGIRAWEYASLMALIGPLFSGAETLNMRYPHDKGEGLCIGMLVAEHNAHPQPFHYVLIERSSALKPLYAPGYPFIIGHPGWLATGAEGAEAIIRFVTGQSPWEFKLCGGAS